MNSDKKVIVKVYTGYFNVILKFNGFYQAYKILDANFKNAPYRFISQKDESYERELFAAPDAIGGRMHENTKRQLGSFFKNDTSY